MENDPALDGKFLGKITQDFVLVADFLKEASYQMRVRKISTHPIFLMSKTVLQTGALLIKIGEKENTWNYYIAMMEEFVQKGLIDVEKQEDFINVYKDADEFCCIFMVMESFTNFIFIPYPEDL